MFERVQFAVLLAVKQDPKLMSLAAEVIQNTARLLTDDKALFNEADAKRAATLVTQLRSAIKIRVLRADLEAVRARITQISGQTMPQLMKSLLRHKPAAPAEPTRAKSSVAAKKSAHRR